MRLNPQKTFASNNVIKNSIKPDKLYWIVSKNRVGDIRKHLLLIHKLSEEYPNSGSLKKALSNFNSRIKGITETIPNIKVLISILADIMYKNPITYEIASAILSKLLSFIPDYQDKIELLNLIYDRLKKIPNIGYIEIWLQRLTIKLDRQKNFEINLCKKVNDDSIRVWNSDWVESKLKTLIEATPIIDEGVIESMNIIIASDEVQIFFNDYDYLNQDESLRFNL